MFTIFRVFILAVFCLISACANQSDKPRYGSHQFLLQSNTGSYNWSTKISSLSGKIHVNAQLQPDSLAKIVFRSRDISRHHPPITITFSDVDCDDGHQVAISYIADKNAIYSEYFKNPIPWHENFNLIINLEKNGEFTIRLNEETLSGKIKGALSSAELVSQVGVMDVKNLTYTSSNNELLEK